MALPVSISVYEHAAQLITRRPWDVSRNAELLLAAHRAAYQLYHHFPVVVGIDIYNLEAEAYGCRVCESPGNGIPAITEPLFANLNQAMTIQPFDPERDGRLPMILGVASQLQREFPEADIRIPISGPFSIAQNLLGLNELMIAAMLEPGNVRRLLQRLVPGQLAYCRAARRAGVKAAFFESAAAPPLLSPAQFREIELPPLKEAMAGISKIMGQPAPCILGGDTQKIVPELLETGTRFLICPAETDRSLFLKQVVAHPEVAVRINMNPALSARGPREAIAREINAIAELAAQSPNPILLGTGALPYETPPENILYIIDYAGKVPRGAINGCSHPQSRPPVSPAIHS
ncbi:MAG: hypothetical protein KKG09_02290 [Verrucomicrobia bacterium]|nr:hypothetical protein [Verrucomicrobiota bacterium]MCG2681742.1 hypothetical protein [Kiritimatiellia bacterium]MBU4247650.1 hypothetical protein [Verrucomicrobiota bacterium]MBU4290471.1 hypothetical protein [Verrucomicrobiota bacterium]MBU4428209.1 hypothetical protein [Verrucomicrobiota bacterium]